MGKMQMLLFSAYGLIASVFAFFTALEPMTSSSASAVAWRVFGFALCAAWPLLIIIVICLPSSRHSEQR
jgi:hypothetical protein